MAKTRPFIGRSTMSWRAASHPAWSTTAASPRRGRARYAGGDSRSGRLRPSLPPRAFRANSSLAVAAVEAADERAAARVAAKRAGSGPGGRAKRARNSVRRIWRPSRGSASLCHARAVIDEERADS
jgi:hypothetical protein